MRASTRCRTFENKASERPVSYICWHTHIGDYRPQYGYDQARAPAEASGGTTTLHGVVFQKNGAPAPSPQFPAREPALAAAVERFHRGAVEAGHVGLDLVADPGL